MMHRTKDYEQNSFFGNGRPNFIYFAYKETLHNIFIVIPIFLDLENTGQDTIFVTLSCIGTKILNKIAFSVMAALICI